MPFSVLTTPDYSAYRTGLAAVDTDFTQEAHGINCAGRDYLNIQVLPSGGANPSIQLYSWCAALSQFIPLADGAFAGQGANKPYEVSYAARGRLIFVGVATMASGACDLYASSYGLNLL